VLGCSPEQIGPCTRCQGLTRRYGRNAQLVCPHCRAVDVRTGSGSG
jgi:hypothetical protein